jgi:phosphate transport system permease protein
MLGMDLYQSRKRRNGVSVVLYYSAAIFGIIWLVLILFSLLREGIGGMSLAVFTENTPPPGSAGGLLNAIVGSLIMTSLGVVVGTPIGLLAGTYLAEYGRGTLLASVVRFINDILLSAPSIVVGLFIYQIMVVPTFTISLNATWLHWLLGNDGFKLTLGGHFSGLAGAVALAVIVIPVVVRTTEDMLLLVPPALREAGTALGMPRALVINKVAYKAAKSGLITGMLLAVARISGETAPLLFTALNNQFFQANLNQPMPSLPVVIFQFALSPYKDWQHLAWAGALIITLAVLTLSITARLIGSRKAV